MILNFLLSLVGAILGGYILLFGRRALWASLGIIGLLATADLLAVLVAGLDSGWDLIEQQVWSLLGIALAAGVLGLILGWLKPAWAAALIGFAAGADVALWLFDILAYLVTDIAQLSEQVVLWIGLGLIVLGGLAGLWFVRTYRDEALILITIVLGTRLIILSLGLSTSSSWTAVAILSLALLGVIWQYADYLRQSRLNPPQAEI